MELLFLGSGGNNPVPTPTCTCEICAEARREGVPYARNGNSMYLPELNAVVDAPEQTFSNLEREGIDEVDYVLLTHWHPDHVCGIRAVQARDLGGFDAGSESFFERYLGSGPTVVTTRAVFEETCELTGLDYWVEVGIADVHFLDEQPLEVQGVSIEAIPYSLSGDDDLDATAFVLEDGERTLVIASDDARYVEASALPGAIDLAVFECGLVEHDPAVGGHLGDDDVAALSPPELRHEEVMARIDRVEPERTILTEIDHLYGRSYDDYRRLEGRDDYDGVRFAYDGLSVTV